MELSTREAQQLAATLLAEGADADDPGARAVAPGPFGRYRVVRLIAAGGMGEVYEAEQESPHRRVAIKTVRPELLSPELARRFDLEARVLARLQHPGIAQVYEAGHVETSGGTTPFFAMEYVEGKPLTEFARERALTVRARLGLFLRVCEAVEHAHQRGVIHRDLKPGNILIDAAGNARVLDFGVARATDADVRASTLHTEAGRLLGTLPYMSPEQVAGDPADLDTRSDVYSLGVVLYELLAGKLPYDVGRGPVAAAARTIAETEPAPLSAVDRVFRGDLDTIVAKALSKEKGRRYQSVSALGADLRRFLADEPIEARPASALYQVRKFARRNSGLMFGLGVAAAVLVAGSAASVTFAVRATAAADEVKDANVQLDRAAATARDEAARARATVDFLRTMLSSVSPAIAKGGIRLCFGRSSRRPPSAWTGSSRTTRSPEASCSRRSVPSTMIWGSTTGRNCCWRGPFAPSPT
ncbi:MAG: serine/threonine-protein kinase [Phycisphaerales bacterium]